MGEKPKVIAAVLVEDNGKLLLAKEKLESGNEHWLVPGGKVEFGETLQQAALREIKEETGFDIEITKLIDFHEAIHTKFDYHTIIFFYLAKIKGGSLKLPEEILDAKFFTREEINNLNLVSSAKWLIDKHFSNI